jgi:isopentenyldiphosphate isomerase
MRSRESMVEQLDIYDANLRHLGIMEREEVHRRGHWHKTFHCWVVSGSPNGALLFQLRSQSVRTFSRLLDVSAAGHLKAGESVDLGIREVSEELGIPVPPEPIPFLGYRVAVADFEDGQKDREFQAVHMFRFDATLDSYSPQAEEVAGLFWVQISLGLRLFGGTSKQIPVRGIAYDQSSDLWVPSTMDVTPGDFVPRIQNYYLAACIMAERLLEGRLPLAIS